MARSNAPQSLSVVSVTHPGSVELTAYEIMKFDGKRIGFTHDRTWAAMPMALTGKFDAEAVLRQLGSAHPRVARSIAGLCALGQEKPLETFRFRDHPDAGIKEVEGLRLGPDVTIVARASCWHVREGVAIIPLLQPRTTELDLRKLGIYTALGRRAFCKGDWVSAKIEIVDLSQSDADKNVEARIFTEADVPEIDDEELNAFLKVYIQGQELAASIRAAKASEKKPKEPPPMPLFPEPDE